MVLYSEENIISLRTAMVLEDGDMISLFLAPPPESFATPGNRNYLKPDVLWLCRRVDIARHWRAHFPAPER
jgi:hypothetical protein